MRFNICIDMYCNVSEYTDMHATVKTIENRFAKEYLSPS